MIYFIDLKHFAKLLLRLGQRCWHTHTHTHTQLHYSCILLFIICVYLSNIPNTWLALFHTNLHPPKTMCICLCQANFISVCVSSLYICVLLSVFVFFCNIHTHKHAIQLKPIHRTLTAKQ